jgi:hypothetical protein
MWNGKEKVIGRTLAETYIHWLLKSENRVQFHGNPCGISRGKSGSM